MMNKRLKLPGTPRLIKVFYWICAFLLLYTLLTLWHDRPPEPTQQPKPPIIITNASFEQARQIEMAWINNTFDPEWDYLLAPVSPLPCPNDISDIPEDIRAQTQQAINTAQTNLTRSISLLNPMVRGNSAHWLPVLTLAVLYAQHNQDMAALQILERYLAASARQALIERLKQNQDKSEDTRIYMIHLLYMNALLRLKTQQYHRDHLLWNGLKYPIRFSRQLGLIPTSNKQPIQTPGCPYNANDLTTYALYNNLIVGYLKTQNFKASEWQWQKECKRQYGAPPLNPMFPILDELCSGNIEMETYWEWTISNAEELLTMAPTPPDSLLSFNLMLLIDSLLKQHGNQLTDEVQKALSQKKEEMHLLSLNEWETAPEEYKQILGPSLAKSATSIAVNQAGSQIPTDLELYQTDEQDAKVIKGIRLTVNIRNSDDLIQWLTTRRGDIEQTLENRADDWLNAMDKDITNIEHLPPPEGQLNKVLKLVSTWLSYNTNKLVLLFIIGFIWLGLIWMAIQIRESKALFTSFYGQEWEIMNSPTRT
jgi:hypothetical protein